MFDAHTLVVCGYGGGGGDDGEQNVCIWDGCVYIDINTCCFVCDAGATGEGGYG